MKTYKEHSTILHTAGAMGVAALARATDGLWRETHPASESRKLRAAAAYKDMAVKVMFLLVTARPAPTA